MPDDTPLPAADRNKSRLGALSLALERAGHHRSIREMQPMADIGLAHHHVWLSRGEIDWVARLPKQSQMGLHPSANLAYQAACFERASEGGHAPALHDILAPDSDLPRGGLLVSAIRGRPARLPEDLPAIAEALASFHLLELPPLTERQPLLSPGDPWGAMRDEVADQASFLDHADLAVTARQRIEAELASLPDRLPAGPASEPRLISFDAHPGNFLVTESGRAVLVDLEKCRYGLPGFDLAHASLYTSTTWDLQSHAQLTPEEVIAFYRCWTTRMGIDHQGPTLLACRRAMWLWSLTWCAKWRASHRLECDASARGEDWSAELSDDALVAHVRDRVDHYLEPATIEHVQEEFRLLESALTE